MKKSHFGTSLLSVCLDVYQSKGRKLVLLKTNTFFSRSCTTQYFFFFSFRMHTVGLHSALAIKRQRKRREEMKKARERRFSSQSTESGLGGSRSSCNSPGSFGGSTDHLRSFRRKHKAVGPGLTDTKVVSSIGMLHIGIVFLVLGMFLIGSGIIPDDYTTWDAPINWWNELVFTGITAIVIGIFLIVLNHYLSQREEDELSRYVEQQLTRSRSGKRLIKDEETGCLSTKNEKRARESATVETEVHTHYPVLKSPPGVSISTPKSDLEKILEEELLEDSTELESYPMESLGKPTIGNGCSPQYAEPRQLVVTRCYETNHH